MLILADDLTGALEVGCSFASTGKSVGVYLQNTTSITDITVVNTNTRNASPVDIDKQFQSISPQLQQHQGFIYKKIDSTLRGPIKQELGLLWRQGFEQFVIAPAYPKLKRLTKKGYQYVNGQKVNESSAGQDLLSPATTSYIPDLLTPHLQNLCRVITCIEKQYLEKEHVLVVDIETDNALQQLAKSLLENSYGGIIVGSNGLAQALANQFSQAEPIKLLIPKTLFIISGSNHPVTHQQLDNLKKTELLESQESIWLLESPRENHNTREVQVWLQQEFLQQLQTKKPEALMIMGGETAYNLLSYLGVTRLKPLREVASGVPMSMMNGGVLDGIPVITKSGGFGETNLLFSILKSLELL